MVDPRIHTVNSRMIDPGEPFLVLIILTLLPLALTLGFLHHRQSVGISPADFCVFTF